MNPKNLLWPVLLISFMTCICRAAEPVSSPAQSVQLSSPTSFAWRNDPRFAKFVPDPALPQLIALDKTKLQVGATLTLNLSALSTISDQDRAALAKLLNLPQIVSSNCVAAFARQKIQDAETLGKELRAYVTDYKFLVHVWNEFVSLEQESPKKEARVALASGDVQKAWQLYPTPSGDHPKPPPPELRVVKKTEENPPPGK